MKKDLPYYLSLHYPITISQDEENGKIYFEADIPDLPGCGAHGETIEEALKKLEEAKQLWLEVSLERDISIPEPALEDEFSGKFLLRIPPRLHMQLTKAARKDDMSLNQYIRNSLAKQVDINRLIEKIDEISTKVDKLAKVYEVYTKLIKSGYIEWTVNPEEQMGLPGQYTVAGITSSTWNMDNVLDSQELIK